MKKSYWTVQKCIQDRANYESMIEWANTPNLVAPKVTLGERNKDSVGWYVLINNMCRESKRLLNELAP